MATKKKMLQAAAGVGGEPEGAWDLSYAYYDDPNGWDLSTADRTKYFNISAQETTPTGVFLKPDGTKMYVVGYTSDRVHEYDLSTAWDIATATLLQNFSVSAQDTSPTDLFFKSDGTKMYIAGNSGNDINEYDLSTAWDVSSASFLQNFSVNAQETAVSGVFFKPDGTKMYITGTSGDEVNEYDLSTAWDISSASFLQLFSVSAQESSPQGVSFKSDGTKMYVLGLAGQDINEYDLSTAWDISTASYLQSLTTAFVDDAPYGIFFSPFGGYMYLVGAEVPASVNQYRLGGFSVTAQETSPEGLFFKPDGTKMYVAGSGGDDVNEYNLSTAWDTSTATFVQSFSVAAQETFPQDVTFKPDGTKMYITGANGVDVNEYNLSTAWNISTASFLQSFSVSDVEGSPQGAFFKPDGTKMYVAGSGGDKIYEYDLSTEWDVSTASLLQSLTVSPTARLPSNVFFKPDGTKMFISDDQYNNVLEYDISTAWDVSSALYSQAFSVSGQESSVKGLFFHPDGTQFFIVGTAADRVFTYTLGPQD